MSQGLFWRSPPPSWLHNLSRSVAFALFSAAALVGCDQHVSIFEPVEPPPIPASAASSPFDPSKLILAGSYIVPITSTNGPPGYGGYAPRPSGIEVENSTWVRVRVSGAIKLGVTAEYASIYCKDQWDIDSGRCTRLRGQQVGPMGVVGWNDALKVSVFVGETQVPLSPVPGDENTVEGVVQATGPVQVSRRSFRLLFDCPDICLPVLTFSGQQTLTVDTIRTGPACPAPSSAAAQPAFGTAAVDDRAGESSACEEEDDAGLVLECSGDLGANKVTRGQEITCTTRKDPADAPGALTISSWTFDGEPRTDGDPTSVTWNGVMVKGGVVEVKGTIGSGTEQTARTTIQVKDRAWSPAFTVREIANGEDGRLTLPNLVTYAHDLGAANFFDTPTPHALPPEVVEIVDSGPNDGLRYFTDLAIPVYAYYVLNHAAMKPGSAFYLAQEEVRPGGTRIGGINWCDRSVVVGSLPGLVEAHELRHIEVYKEVFAREIQPVLVRLESMSAADATELLDAYEPVYNRVDATARAQSEAIHDIPNADNPDLVNARDTHGRCLLKNQFGRELKNPETAK
ncbi:MAG: hypothetical protein AB1941_11820 [Gemmatimonadota bacterium]